MRVIVHGGAGSAPDEPEPRQAVLDEAATTGAAATGTPESTPLDAVEAAVRVLETSPRFNAGVGGAVQSDGVVRTDAGVMTSDRRIGAACSMPGVEHAVSVARVVMAETPHVLVSGEHAVDLADAFEIGTDADLLTTEKHERYEAENPPNTGVRAHLDWLETRFGTGDDEAGERSGRHGEEREAPDHDTVGAVASDGERFAAATSTGGRSFALAGRVGDVPQVGSGFFCTEAGGASATGAGEDIARVTLSERAVSYLEDGLDAGTAAERAMADFEALTGSGAGVIVLDADGAGSAFNTDAMQTSVAVEE